MQGILREEFFSNCRPDLSIILDRRELYHQGHAVECQLHWNTTSKLKPEESGSFQEIVNRIPEVSEKFFKSANRTRKTDFLNIVIINDAYMKKLNHSWRGKNETTDVVTFEFERKNQKDSTPSGGEIYISLPKAKKQSREQSISIVEELVVLVVHGLVHAYGYDHEISASESVRMQKLETRILNYLGYGAVAPLTG